MTNPFRDLIETYLLYEMIVRKDDSGVIIRDIVTLEDFTTVTAKSVYRSIVIQNGDLWKTIDSIHDDYPDKVRSTFLGRLKILQESAFQATGLLLLPELDLDELFGVLRRNDDVEIITYCVERGLYSEERGSHGHPIEVPGVRH